MGDCIILIFQNKFVRLKLRLIFNAHHRKMSKNDKNDVNDKSSARRCPERSEGSLSRQVVIGTA